MPTTQATHLPAASDAVERGLAFLASRQLPSGQIPTYVGPDLQADPVFDSSPFTTALVVNALAAAPAPQARQLIGRGLDFLCAEMEPGGVWRYWASDHPGHRLIPPDLDDIACVSSALAEHGRTVPPNRRLLLANRDRKHRFYTWVTPRYAPPPLSRSFWRVARRQTEERGFFTANALSAHDVSGVVNANVLHYLGDGRAARPVVRYLIEILDRRAEGHGDAWYDSAFPFYYSVARCFADGIAGLTGVADPIESRISAGQDASGQIGATMLDTALAVCALRWLGRDSPVATRACEALLANQASDGSWEIAPLYHGGPPDRLRWGSRELTTGFSLQALIPVASESRPA